MIDPIFIFNLCLVVFGISYAFIIILYTIGWFSLKSKAADVVSGSTYISIIIPCRNEEENISNLLHDLIRQQYPADLFEIIVVDDHSTDHTREKVIQFIQNTGNLQIRLIQVPDENHAGAYKKKAIQLAIAQAMGNLIITTDADCRMGDQWLKTIVRYYELSNSKIIVGPVCFHNEKSWFEKMQTIEFLSLIGITAGAISMEHPIMCNGANLAYEKTAFDKVGGFGDDRFSSGDDVFLLLKLKKYFGNKSVGFLKNEKAFVFTEAKKNLREFIHQRTRWASKNKGYDLKILSISFTVYIVNLLIIVGLLWGVWDYIILKNILIIYFFKLLIELPVLLGVVKFAKRIPMLMYSFPLVLLYPFYIVITGALGIVSSYQWKGRTLKR